MAYKATLCLFFAPMKVLMHLQIAEQRDSIVSGRHLLSPGDKILNCSCHPLQAAAGKS